MSGSTHRRDPETPGELERYYQARAAEYERIYAKPERQSDLRLLEGMVGERLAGRHVLEIACGTGYWTRHIADRAASIVAVDLNEETLAVARRKGLDAAKVRFMVGDAYRLPAALGPFDGVFAGFWWSHVRRADWAGFVASLDAVTSRGARVLLLDNRYVEGSSTPIARRDAAGDTYQERSLDDGSRYEILKNFPDEAELRAALGERGRAARLTSLDYFWLLEYEHCPSR